MSNHWSHHLQEHCARIVLLVPIAFLSLGDHGLAQDEITDQEIRAESKARQLIIQLEVGRSGGPRDWQFVANVLSGSDTLTREKFFYRTLRSCSKMAQMTGAKGDLSGIETELHRFNYQYLKEKLKKELDVREK